jgi:hypothetical protein
MATTVKRDIKHQKKKNDTVEDIISMKRTAQLLVFSTLDETASKQKLFYKNQNYYWL